MLPRSAAIVVSLVAATSVHAQLTFGGGSQLVRTETVYSPVRGPGTGNPFGGVVPGIALVGLSSALLWWNEGRTARTERLLADARRALQPIDGGSRAALDGTHGLVHLSGHLTTSGVRDSLFDEVRRPGALRLQRTTEAFQWEETKHVTERRVSQSHVQRETRYDYHTAWSARRVDSGHFQDGYHHRNPTPRLPPGTVETVASDATLPNGLRVPAELLEQLSDWESTPLPPLRPRDGAVRAPLPERGTESIYLAAPGTEARVDADSVPAGARPPPPSRRITSGRDDGSAPADGARRYLEEEHQRLDRLDGRTMGVAPLPPAPVVGDERVSFQEVPVPEDGVSILAAVGPAPGMMRFGGGGAKHVLRPWLSAADAAAAEDEASSAAAAAGSGGVFRHFTAAPSLFLLVRGRVGPRAMLQLARQRADRLKWLLRGCGAAGMWAGLAMTLSFLPALAGYVPLVGGLAASLTGLATGLAALGGALAGSSLVMAAAWARFRPLHAAGLGLAAAAAAAGQAWLLRQRALAHAGQTLSGKPPVVARPHARPGV